MTYESHGFYPFHLRVFHVKIVVSLWLFYYCFVGFVAGLFVCWTYFGTQKEKYDF